MTKKFPFSNFRRDDKSFRGPYGGDRRHHEGRTNHYGREGYAPNRPRDKAPLLPPRNDYHDVEFGSEGLSRKTTMKFTVIRAPSPYNVILGRSGLKALRAIPSTIHAMMKFPTPRGIATLITRSTTVSECRKLEDKQVMCDGEISYLHPRTDEELTTKCKTQQR
ncbi:hypothetical protein CTI12_AA599440 [Artemisia annua]|uniref:Reverse transcriptase domain-containing protein n=1 Tax=Artemisia annua TaxID=35608 RepID=A0A2U1KIJ8_ARTAN|nr:hypothetical protein CTI12_AA599440 [Artemisia annua]